MTYPEGTVPSGAISSTGLAAFANKTQSEWEDDIAAGLTTSWTDAETGFSDITTGVGAAVEDLADLGVTATSTELNYVDGVTSAIQPQLDAKASLTGSETLTNKEVTSPVITSGNAPSTASDTGTAGQVEWDASYIYICTATDTWKRAAIATW